MTEIFTNESSRRRAGVRHLKKTGIRIDMTPMVDLGFLLITFFVMTTELSKPSVVNLAMPKNGPPTELGNSNALTILLDANKVYYYEGNFKDALAQKKIVSSSLSVNNGVGDVIREKQQRLDKNNKKEGRNGLMLLIKANKEASYHDMVKALDEVMINTIRKYTILPVSQEEATWMKTR